jgi:UPF0716 protein FxsA
LERRQGYATLAKLQQETNAGRVPAMQIAEGVALLFAGAVLMTPGFITDAIGFAILIPPVRQALIAWAAKNLIKGRASAVYGSSNSSVNPHVEQGDVIEGEYTVSEPQDKK